MLEGGVGSACLRLRDFTAATVSLSEVCEERGVTREYTSFAFSCYKGRPSSYKGLHLLFLLILQGMALQLQGITRLFLPTLQGSTLQLQGTTIPPSNITRKGMPFTWYLPKGVHTLEAGGGAGRVGVVRPRATEGGHTGRSSPLLPRSVRRQCGRARRETKHAAPDSADSCHSAKTLLEPCLPRARAQSLTALEERKGGIGLGALFQNRAVAFPC